MVERLLLNASHAPSLINFRGPLIRDLVAMGIAVETSAPATDTATHAAIEALGATFHALPLERAGQSPLADWRYYRAIRQLIARTGCDFVLNYTAKPNIWGSLAAMAQGVRSASMVTGLGHLFEPAHGWKRAAIAKAARVLLRRATDANDIVIFQNPDDIADFVASGALRDASKARRVYGSGVDIAHFHCVPLPKAPVFLFAGRLLAAKGVREFAEAAMALKRQHPEWRFVIAGDLDAAPSSIARSELDGWIAAGIEWLGWVEDMRGPLAQASVFVLPSHREGTPRTVLEAAAMGRPVITTDAPGCRETVIDGETGLLVPVRDAAAIHSAMDALGHDPALRATYAKAARAMCERLYAVDKVNRALIEHLQLR